VYAEIYVQPLATEAAEGGTKLVASREEITALFTPKQHEIYAKMMQQGIVCLLGSRKTGKSFLMAKGIIDLGSKARLKIEILSAKKENAAFIVGDVYELCEHHDLDIIDPKNRSVTKCGFKNGTHIRTHSNTIADTGTFRADILIIDEAQEVDQEVWSKIIPMIAKEGEMRVWIFGTAKAGTPFHNLITNPPRDLDVITQFEMHMEDAEWVKPEKWKVVEALMADDRMVRQELKLEWVEPEGAFFRAEDIDVAFQPYEIPMLNRMGEMICCLDFGSEGSEMVYIVLGYYNGEIYELDSWSVYNPPTDVLLSQVHTFWVEYRPLFIMENSPLGSYVRRDITRSEHNYRCTTSGFSHNKDKFWFALQWSLNNHKLHLKTHKLRQQLLRYCGDKKKDDWVDSLLHGVKYYFDLHYREADKWIFN